MLHLQLCMSFELAIEADPECVEASATEEAASCLVLLALPLNIQIQHEQRV